MEHPAPRPETEMPIIKLLPNALTLLAVCAGMTAIRFGFQGDFERAVQLILVASVLDGLDGRLARLLRCETLIGAELDSLADFVNFGVTPALVVYAWVLQDHPRAGWIAVLIFAICCLVRLARFNVALQDAKPKDIRFFVGVPAPAGAIIVLMPMFWSFSFTTVTEIHPWLMIPYMVVVGLLMVSRLPTYSFKNMTVARKYSKFALIGFVLLCVLLFIYFWETLLVMVLFYVGSIIIAFLRANSNRQSI